jgi:hypothetical protein
MHFSLFSLLLALRYIYCPRLMRAVSTLTAVKGLLILGSNLVEDT